MADAAQKTLWDDEWQRCFGSSRFDFVVDFSGYSPLWATLLLHSPEARRTIWMHNDMVAELDREVDGKKPLERSLQSIFGLYPEYDSLVAVSPALATINQRRLGAAFLAGRTIASAVNLINSGDILSLAKRRVFQGEVDDDGIPDWVGALEADDDAVWFVTVGRYTREKNQALLLDAFAEVHAGDPRARLLLVGHGPLEEELRAQVIRLGLSGVAFVTGALRNPFSVLEAADCFVLSSDYEGQPMVLLEAAVLGLPIVSTEFGSIRDVLPDGMVHVVEPSTKGLAAGLRAFLAGDVVASPFDADAYNAEARDQFEDVTGLAERLAKTGVAG
jgi:glycosyltransferase involved in cell wall biosynthesis